MSISTQRRVAMPVRLDDLAPCLVTQARRRPFAWSRIVPEDRFLLRQCVDRDRPTTTAYEDSWGYIVQATRHGGFKLTSVDDGLVAFLAFKSCAYDTLVVPNFFGGAAQMARAASAASAVFGTSVVLKNVVPSHVPVFFRHGFRAYGPEEGWDPDARFDDQTFPQVLVELDRIVRCQGGGHRKLRNILNREVWFTLRPYQDVHCRDVLELLRRKDASDRAGSEGLYEESHAMYLHDAAHGLDRYVLTDGDAVRGFLATSDINRETVALCAAVFEEGLKEKQGIKELAPWGIYTVFSRKHKEGYRFANLGGSEARGTFEFKRQTFNPSQLLHRTHLVRDRRPDAGMCKRRSRSEAPVVAVEK